MSNNQKRKFHEVTEQARRANLDYNSQVDIYRKHFRVAHSRRFKAPKEQLWDNVMTALKKLYKFKEEDLFVGLELSHKAFKDSYNFKIDEYEKGKIISIVWEEGKYKNVRSQIFQIKPLWWNKKKFKLLYIEAVDRDETIQGYQAQIDKMLFKTLLRKNWKNWKAIVKYTDDEYKKTTIKK